MFHRIDYAAHIYPGGVPVGEPHLHQHLLRPACPLTPGAAALASSPTLACSPAFGPPPAYGPASPSPPHLCCEPPPAALAGDALRQSEVVPPRHTFPHCPHPAPPPTLSDRPLVLHYGREFEVAGYTFRKHWFHEFDPFQCPPWPHMKPPGTTNVRGGLFPHPPHPSVFWQQVRLGTARGVRC